MPSDTHDIFAEPGGRAIWGVGLGPSLAGIAGSNLAGGMDLCLVSFVCFQVEVSASSLSLVRRSSTECGVSECDHEVSTRHVISDF